MLTLPNAKAREFGTILFPGRHCCNTVREHKLFWACNDQSSLPVDTKSSLGAIIKIVIFIGLNIEYCLETKEYVQYGRSYIIFIKASDM
jgi:hypothetical protein